MLDFLDPFKRKIRIALTVLYEDQHDAPNQRSSWQYSPMIVTLSPCGQNSTLYSQPRPVTRMHGCLLPWLARMVDLHG